MSQSDDFLKNIANLLQDTDSLLMEFDMRSASGDDVVDLSETNSSLAIPTISSDNDDDDVVLATPPARRQRRGTTRGVRRRTTRGGRRELVAAENVVDLCSPMAPPPTARTRGRQPSAAVRGRRRGARSEPHNDWTVELLDDSVTDAVAGPSGVVRAVASEQEDGGNNVSADGSGPNCPICLCTWVAPVSTLCGHIFCKSCIEKWLKSCGKAAAKCPVCKAGPSKLKTHPIFIA